MIYDGFHIGGVVEYGEALDGNWCNWVSIGWNWFIYDGSGSVQGGTGHCWVVLGHKKAVVVGTWKN